MRIRALSTGVHQRVFHRIPAHSRGRRHLKARVAHLPTWAALRGFLQAVDRRPREELTALRVAIRGLKGENRDFTNPEHWVTAHVEGSARALGLAIWKVSKGALNPRYVAHAASLANRYDLVEEDDDGVLVVTDAGRDFVDVVGGDTERALDVAEGVARVLALVAEHGPLRSAELLDPYMDWSLKHTGMKSETTVRVSLHARLTNLMERGLVERTGHSYAITATVSMAPLLQGP